MDQRRQVVVATHNAGKLVEMRRILCQLMDGVDKGVELISSADLDLPDPTETGTTFAENALLKARVTATCAGLPALADDSGLVVDVLGAAPGILSARWSGRHGDDQANIDLLLAQLADIPDKARSARFVCAAALVVPDLPGYPVRKRSAVRLGEMPGRILRERRGGGGFGYDPIFQPDDQPARVEKGAGPLTSAQMTPDEKNAVSHRGKALAAIMPVVVDWVLGNGHGEI